MFTHHFYRQSSMEPIYKKKYLELKEHAENNYQLNFIYNKQPDPYHNQTLAGVDYMV